MLQELKKGLYRRQKVLFYNTVNVSLDIFDTQEEKIKHLVSKTGFGTDMSIPRGYLCVLDSEHVGIHSRLSSTAGVSKNLQSYVSININTGESLKIDKILPSLEYPLLLKYRDDIFNLTTRRFSKYSLKNKTEKVINLQGQYGFIKILLMKGFELLVITYEEDYRQLVKIIDPEKFEIKKEISFYYSSYIDIQELNEYEFIISTGSIVSIFNFQDIEIREIELSNAVLFMVVISSHKILIFDMQKNLIILDSTEMRFEFIHKFEEDILGIEKLNEDFIFLKSDVRIKLFSIRERKIIWEGTCISGVVIKRDLPLSDSEEKAENIRMGNIIKSILPISKDLEGLIVKYI